MHSKRFGQLLLRLMWTGIMLRAGIGQLQAGDWSTAASTCAVDETSAGKYQTNNGELRFLAAGTGQIIARCNITNPLDTSKFPPWNSLQITYRDPDASAVNTSANQVEIALRRVAYINGVSETITTFNSSVRPASQFAQWTLHPVNHAFDFYNYAYYLQIKLTRSTSVGNDPGVYRVRLWAFGI